MGKFLCTEGSLHLGVTGRLSKQQAGFRLREVHDSQCIAVILTQLGFGGPAVSVGGMSLKIVWMEWQ